MLLSNQEQSSVIREAIYTVSVASTGESDIIPTEPNMKLRSTIPSLCRLNSQSISSKQDRKHAKDSIRGNGKVPQRLEGAQGRL